MINHRTSVNDLLQKITLGLSILTFKNIQQFQHDGILYNYTKILRVKKSRFIEGEKGENSLNIIFTVVIDVQYFEWFEQIFQLLFLL